MEMGLTPLYAYAMFFISSLMFVSSLYILSFCDKGRTKKRLIKELKKWVNL